MVRCKTNAGSPAKHLKNTNKHYFFRNQQTISMHSSSTVLKFNNSENFVYFVSSRIFTRIQRYQIRDERNYISLH